MNDKIEKVISNPEDYKYGFKNEDVSVKKTNIGLNEDIVREISSLKNEPEWMLEYRLKSQKTYEEVQIPSNGPDINTLDFSYYTYFIRP